MNIGRCYATRLYVAGFFSSYAINELQEKIELETYGTRKTRVVHRCCYCLWILGSNTGDKWSFYIPSGYFLFWLYLKGCNWNEYIWVSKHGISSFIKLQLNYVLLILIYLLIAIRKKYEFYHCLRAKLHNNPAPRAMSWRSLWVYQSKETKIFANRM